MRTSMREATLQHLRVGGSSVVAGRGELDRPARKAVQKLCQARGPAPFAPGEAFARFVDVSAMPPDDPTASVNEQLVHLRLRLLDRWLRAHAPSVVVAG